MSVEMILVPRYELLAWAEEWQYENDPGDGTDCITPFDTYLLKSPVEAQAVRAPAEALRCTCPSGDGSLRWPCPAHPPEAQPVYVGVDLEGGWIRATAPAGVGDLSCCGGNDETPKSHCMDCSRYPGQLAQQPAAPSGETGGDWVTVPRVPTDAMLDAMHGRIQILCDPAERTADIQNDAEVWGAMLTAAPQQPAAVDGAQAALREAAENCLPFVAYAFDQGIAGAEEAGRELEAALDAQQGGES